MPGIAYDDSGSLAGYFGVTFLAVVLVPATYIVFRPAQKEPLQPLCHCSECRANFARINQRRASTHTRRFARRLIPLLAGWALFAYLSYVIANAPRAPGGGVYDPFQILGLGSSSTEKQIKKHYKKLSLQFHPDKIKLAENQTKEDADSRFVELTKAYKSLTDEVTRENLAKYGNPDGPQQREDKIAIPQWVVEGKNSIWVLGAYGLMLGGGIPYIVGRWWFSQRRHTRDGILNPTAEHFFYNLKEDTDFSNLLTILAGALELGTVVLGGKRKPNKKERKERQGRVEELEKELQQRKEAWGVEENPLIRAEHKVAASTAVARRARALLWAHLLRVDLDEGMKAEQQAVLHESQPVLNALLNIALAHNWLATSLLCINLQAALVQALPPLVSPLAQFPGISPERGLELQVTQRAEGGRWLEKWVKRGAEKDEKRQNEIEAISVTKEWPRLEIVSAEFKVQGEKVIPPSSVVNIHVRLRYVYPTTSSSVGTNKSAVPAAIKAELPNGDSHGENGEARPSGPIANGEDAGIESDVKDEKEVKAETGMNAEQDSKGDVKPVFQEGKEVLSDVKEAVLAESEKEVGRKGKPPEKEKVWAPTGYAHAPHWPLLRKPHYHVLLGDSKLDKVIVPPIKITDIPLPRADGLPSDPREYTLSFPAPPQVNLYSFVLYAASDSFLGADADLPMMMKVEEPPEDASADEDDDDDISEPDEDSLAGQMAMMRGGKVKPSAVRENGGGEDDEEGSEYESSSDEEGPRRKKAINEDSDSDSD